VNEKKKLSGFAKFAIAICIMGCLAIGGCVLLIGGAAKVASDMAEDYQVSVEEEKAAEKLKQDGLASATPSELSHTGELAKIFKHNSENTDIQRDNKEKEITGKIVEWTLPVYEVDKSGDGYTVTTRGKDDILDPKSMTARVSTVIALNPSDDDTRVTIEGLLAGDRITIRGYISGVDFVRRIEIEPAILISVDKKK
tara:strand:- start:514 stop:1104 length:591 start_codon:yes stop_codon:yes gene_type:complete